MIGALPIRHSAGRDTRQFFVVSFKDLHCMAGRRCHDQNRRRGVERIHLQPDHRHDAKPPQHRKNAGKHRQEHALHAAERKKLNGQDDEKRNAEI